MNDTLTAFLVCALWSSSGDDTVLDEKTIFDFDPDTQKELEKDLNDFLSKNKDLIQKSNLCSDQIGHDFWLTRNGHGAGFWDRGLGEIGKELTKACGEYGEVCLYVGDDGKVYSM